MGNEEETQKIIEKGEKSKMAAIVGLGERSVLVIKIVYFNPDITYKEWIWICGSELNMASTEVASLLPCRHL